MGRESLLERHERFLAAAVLTAQHLHQKGFRQIEVRHFFDRWAQWQNLIDDYSILNLQNTQIACYLANLV